jgi:hypothetical protein
MSTLGRLNPFWSGLFRNSSTLTILPTSFTTNCPMICIPNRLIKLKVDLTFTSIWLTEVHQAKNKLSWSFLKIPVLKLVTILRNSVKVSKDLMVRLLGMLAPGSIES